MANISLIAAEIARLFKPVHPELPENLEMVIAAKLKPLTEGSKATRFQINKIANRVCLDSSGESRSAKKELAMGLFPDSADEIENAIHNHPIELNWSEFRVCPRDEIKKYLLPES